MKKLAYFLTVAFAVFLLGQESDIIVNDGHPDLPEQVALNTIKNNDWARIVEMGTTAQTGIVPENPPYTQMDSVTLPQQGELHGMRYQRHVPVSNAEELRDALDDAEPGDLIYLADGVYIGNFEARVDGTQGLNITFYGSRNAIIDGNSLSHGYGLYVTGDYWTFIGFSVRNANKGIMTDGANHNIFRSLEIYQIGNEGIHFRTFSSNNRVEQSWIHDVGLREAHLGEAVYIGSAESNWDRYTDGEPDNSDHNQVIGNLLGPNVSAESVDVKEGTTGGVVRDNLFISTETLVVDSWVDVKGNGYEISNNAGIHPASGTFRRAVDVLELVDGWGQDNTVYDNVEYTVEGTVVAPYRAAYTQTGIISIVLPPRETPYTLNELLIRFPDSFERHAADTVLLKESIVVAQGAHLILRSSHSTVVRLLSSPETFVSITGYRAQITIEGVNGRLMEFQSWNNATNAPDMELNDGRAYVFMSGGRMDIAYASFADLGFYEGTVSGVAWKGFTLREEREVSRGDVVHSNFIRNYFGAYTFEAVEMHWYANAFIDNIGYGFDPHDFSNDFIVEENTAYGNGSHGIIFSRGCLRNIIRNNTSYDNDGHGIMLDDGKVLEDPDNLRHLFPVPSDDNIVENNRVWNNEDGIVLEGGNRNIIRSNQVTNSRRFGIRLKDTVAETLVEHNTIEGSVDYAIFVYNNSVSNRIVGNIINGGRTGVVIQSSSANTVQDNTITHVVGYAISLRGVVTDSMIAGNVMSGRGSSAIRLSEVEGVDYNTLVDQNDGSGWHAPSPLSIYLRYGALMTAALIFLTPVGVKIVRGTGKAGVMPLQVLWQRRRKRVPQR